MNKKPSAKGKRKSKKTAPLPDMALERDLAACTGPLIAGIDEAGRGPWAGPVVCAAVVIPEDVSISGLNDSKKLPETAREILYETICLNAMVGIASASPKRIDEMNIRAATLWAMRQALLSLPVDPDGALIDGRDVPPGLPCQGVAIIKGDSRSKSIAAASIIAKVTRDRMMTRLSQSFPEYGFDSHKGYGTARHAAALSEWGVTDHHRKSFKPIMQILEH
ncbi:MAG: ribonuclease HII [Stappiaceae bacterium]